jgi:hypothetical protein
MKWIIEAEDISGLMTYKQLFDTLATATPYEEKPADKKYTQWTNAGGPNECKHGYADGIPCPKCDQEKPTSTRYYCPKCSAETNYGGISLESFKGQKPDAPADLEGLYDQLEKAIYLEAYPNGPDGIEQAYNKVKEILLLWESHPIKALPVEPLAVLASLRGYYVSRIMERKEHYTWIINIEPRIYEFDPKHFVAPTYAACEAKARAYLEGLEDKK